MDENISSMKDKLLVEAHSKRLAAVIEQADELVIVLDTKGRIDYVNPAFERTSGFSQQEAIGQTLALVWHDEEGQIPYAEWWQRLQLGIPYLHVFQNKSKEGSLYEVSQNAFSLHDDHQTYGYAVIQRDITLQKKMEEKLNHADRVSSLGVLAGGIAHDFNNILTTILGNASLALKKLDVETPVYRHIDCILQASHSAADLCRQMLAYSGKGKFVIEPVNLSLLVKNMMKLIEVSVPKHITLYFDVPDNLRMIDADVAQIQQVVLNLLTNAAEAIGEDKPGRITVSIGEMYADKDYLSTAYGDTEKDEGEYIYLEVSDTGCGMSKDIQRQMFDPFFTTKCTGRGLGMSAMLGIVNGHQGALRVYSEQGKGTTFKVIFPVSSTTEEHRTQPSQDKVDAASGLVLVIDDEVSICETARAMLEDMGYSVMTARSGQQGIDIFKQYQDEIQFVLLDMTMPEMDGKECFRLLRVLQPDVRVILSSGYNEQEATSYFAGKGLAGFIQKPYSDQNFSESIKKFIYA